MAEDPTLTASEYMLDMGTTGLRRTGGFVIDEYLTQLIGPHGYRIYREMADNDATIGGILLAIEKVMLRLDWKVQEGGQEPADIELRDFIQGCLDDMSDSWDGTLQGIMSMLVHGYSYHEIVYKRRQGPNQDDPSKRSKFNDNKIGWRKWAIRSQETVWRWEFDDDGGVQGIYQLDPYSGKGQVFIPIQKSLLFRTTTIKNNPEGRSMLRNAYRPWYFKKRIEEIEAVGIERDLAGLPVAFLPPNYLSSGASANEKALRDAVVSIVQGIKRNEQEGVVFPLQYDEQGHKMFDLTLLSTGGQRQFDAQPLSAKILTPTGWTTMGEIQVGDAVVDPLGQTSIVEGVFPKGVRPVYRVTLADGRTVLADHRHKWVVSNSKTRRRGSGDYEPLPGFRVMRTEEIVDWMHAHPNDRLAVPHIMPIEFAPQDAPLPLAPYVLGVLLGDGSMTTATGVRLYTADPEIVDEVMQALPSEDFIAERPDTTSGRASMYRIGASSPSGRGGASATQRALESLGLWNKRSPEKFIPDAYLWASAVDRLNLLQGIVDTDGTVDAHGATVVATSSRALADGLLHLVRSLGGEASFIGWATKPYLSPKTGRVQQGASDRHYHVKFRLPEGMAPARLDRKAQKARGRNWLFNGIKRIEYFGDEPVQCILVSADSHMYVTDEFIPTHNTDKIVTRYDSRIATAFLADFLMLGHEAVGSFALGKTKMELWTMAVDAIAKSIASVINTHAITRLLQLNGISVENPPTLVYGDIAQTDIAEVGDYIQKLVAAGALTPDEKLEEYLRDVAGLPPIEVQAETTPRVSAPPAKVEPPVVKE